MTRPPLNAGSFRVADDLTNGRSAMVSLLRSRMTEAHSMPVVHRERMTQVDTRPTLGWASLTGSERELAGLVARGLTNKQVAGRLFVSRHTVDAHLRHIFRKLDINSRVELAHLVATHVAFNNKEQP